MELLLPLQASTTGTPNTGFIWITGLLAYVLSALALYFVFQKAGQPGWAGFIPIYNAYVLLKVVGRPWWWLLLLLIPFVNIVVIIVVYHDLSRSFGHGVGFTVGLVLLSVVFLFILGLGSSRYLGPAAEGFDRRMIA